MKASHLRIVALILSIGACFVTTASSQILITHSASAPLDGHAAVRIKVPEDSGATRYMMKWWDTRTTQTASRHRETGQTFSLPGTDSLAIEGFTFRLNLTAGEVDGNLIANAAGAMVTLSIYQVTGVNDPTPVGSALYTGSAALPAGILARDYLTFALLQTFEATPGTQYSVQIGFDTYHTKHQMSFATGVSTLYSGGTGFLYENPTGSASLLYGSTGRDLDFAVLYTPVPEASTVGLLSSALLVIVAVGFHRRGKAGAAASFGPNFSSPSVAGRKWVLKS